MFTQSHITEEYNICYCNTAFVYSLNKLCIIFIICSKNKSFIALRNIVLFSNTDFVLVTIGNSY